jgi:hypothetical protein
VTAPTEVVTAPTEVVTAPTEVVTAHSFDSNAQRIFLKESVTNNIIMNDMADSPLEMSKFTKCKIRKISGTECVIKVNIIP